MVAQADQVEAQADDLHRALLALQRRVRAMLVVSRQLTLEMVAAAAVQVVLLVLQAPP
jgi:hypothetical protein